MILKKLFILLIQFNVFEIRWDIWKYDNSNNEILKLGNNVCFFILLRFIDRKYNDNRVIIINKKE